jgi:hypothetical protein
MHATKQYYYGTGNLQKESIIISKKKKRKKEKKFLKPDESDIG